MHTKKRLKLRAIAAALVMAFACGELRAAPLENVASLPPQQMILRDAGSFEAPLQYATLSEIHPGAQEAFIIHIQDAHSNFSGQENLANALDELMKKYDVQLVLSEGGWGDCSLTPMKKIASSDIWEKVARRFLVSGELQGEEYLNLISDRPMKIVGIEDAPLYDKGLESYRKLSEKREGVLDYLEKTERATSKVKSKLYPQELLRYEKNRSVDFEKDFDALWVLAQDHGVDLGEFTSVTELAVLREKEGLVNYDAANLEQAVLAEEISRRGSKETLDSHFEKIKQMRGQPANLTNGGGSAFGGKTAQYTYYHSMMDVAAQKGLDTSKYVNLQAYLEVLEDFSRLDFDGLLGEFDRAEDKVYAAVLTSDDAKKTRSIDRFLRLLRTAHRIQMTSDQFRLFTHNEADFGTEATQAFLNRKLAELGYYDDLIPYESLLSEGREALGAFYDSVKERDFAFVKNVDEALKAEKQKVAVLITGGYHTPHLKKLLAEKGWGYAVLTPIVTSETSQTKYEKLLLSEKATPKKKTKTVSTEGLSKDKSLGALDGDLAKLTRRKGEQMRMLAAVREMEVNPAGSRLAHIADTAVIGSGARLADVFKTQTSVVIARSRVVATKQSMSPGARLQLSIARVKTALFEKWQKISAFMRRQQPILGIENHHLVAPSASQSTGLIDTKTRDLWNEGIEAAHRSPRDRWGEVLKMRSLSPQEKQIVLAGLKSRWDATGGDVYLETIIEIAQDDPSSSPISLADKILPYISKDRTQMLRVAAIVAIGNLGSSVKDGQKGVWDAMSDSSQKVSAHAREAVSKIVDAKTVSKFLKEDIEKADRASLPGLLKKMTQLKKIRSLYGGLDSDVLKLSVRLETALAALPILSKRQHTTKAGILATKGEAESYRDINPAIRQIIDELNGSLAVQNKRLEAIRELADGDRVRQIRQAAQTRESERLSRVDEREQQKFEVWSQRFTRSMKGHIQIFHRMLPELGLDRFKASLIREPGLASISYASGRPGPSLSLRPALRLEQRSHLLESIKLDAATARKHGKRLIRALPLIMAHEAGHLIIRRAPEARAYSFYPGAFEASRFEDDGFDSSSLEYVADEVMVDRVAWDLGTRSGLPIDKALVATYDAGIILSDRDGDESSELDLLQTARHVAVLKQRASLAPAGDMRNLLLDTAANLRQAAIRIHGLDQQRIAVLDEIIRGLGTLYFSTRLEWREGPTTRSSKGLSGEVAGARATSDDKYPFSFWKIAATSVFFHAVILAAMFLGYPVRPEISIEEVQKDEQSKPSNDIQIRWISAADMNSPFLFNDSSAPSSTGSVNQKVTSLRGVKKLLDFVATTPMQMTYRDGRRVSNTPKPARIGDSNIYISVFETAQAQDDAVSQAAVYIEGRGNFDAYDFRATDLARFYNKARSLSGPESAFRDSLVDAGILDRSSGTYGAKEDVAVLTITSGGGNDVAKAKLSHEIVHGIYFTEPGYRQEVEKIWGRLSKTAQEAVKKWLIEDKGYKNAASDRELLLTEFASYFRSWSDAIEIYGLTYNPKLRPVIGELGEASEALAKAEEPYVAKTLGTAAPNRANDSVLRFMPGAVGVPGTFAAWGEIGDRKGPGGIAVFTQSARHSIVSFGALPAGKLKQIYGELGIGDKEQVVDLSLGQEKRLGAASGTRPMVGLISDPKSLVDVYIYYPPWEKTQSDLFGRKANTPTRVRVIGPEEAVKRVISVNQLERSGQGTLKMLEPQKGVSWMEADFTIRAPSGARIVTTKVSKSDFRVQWGRWVPESARKEIDSLIAQGRLNMPKTAVIHVDFLGGDDDKLAKLLHDEDEMRRVFSYQVRVGRDGAMTTKYVYAAPDPSDSFSAKYQFMLARLKKTGRFTDFLPQVDGLWKNQNTKMTGFRRLAAVFHQFMRTEHGLSLVQKELVQRYSVRSADVVYEVAIQKGGPTRFRSTTGEWTESTEAAAQPTIDQSPMGVSIRQVAHIVDSEKDYEARYLGVVQSLIEIQRKIRDERALLIGDPESYEVQLNGIRAGFANARLESRQEIGSALDEAIAAVRGGVSSEAIESIGRIVPKVQADIRHVQGIIAAVDQRKARLVNERKVTGHSLDILETAGEELLAAVQTDAVGADSSLASFERFIKEGVDLKSFSWAQVRALLEKMNTKTFIPAGYMIEVNPVTESVRNKYRGLLLNRVGYTRTLATDEWPVVGYFVERLTPRGKDEPLIIGSSSHFGERVVIYDDAIRMVFRDESDGGVPDPNTFSIQAKEIASAFLARDFKGISQDQAMELVRQSTFIHEAEHEKRRRIIGDGYYEARKRHLGLEEELAELRSMADGAPFHVLGNLIHELGGNTVMANDAWSLLARLSGKPKPMLLSAKRALLFEWKAKSGVSVEELRDMAKRAYSQADLEWRAAASQGARASTKLSGHKLIDTLQFSREDLRVLMRSEGYTLEQKSFWLNGVQEELQSHLIPIMRKLGLELMPEAEGSVRDEITLPYREFALHYVENMIDGYLQSRLKEDLKIEFYLRVDEEAVTLSFMGNGVPLVKGENSFAKRARGFGRLGGKGLGLGVAELELQKMPFLVKKEELERKKLFGDKNGAVIQVTIKRSDFDSWIGKKIDDEKIIQTIRTRANQGIGRYDFYSIPQLRRMRGPFSIQLNPYRQTRRQLPFDADMGLEQPFDPEGFHFNRVNPEEVIEDRSVSGFLARFILNTHPLAEGNFIVAPEPEARHPQYLRDVHWVHMVLSMVSDSEYPNIKMFYNSLGSLGTSVNHLHFQGFYYGGDTLDGPLWQEGKLPIERAPRKMLMAKDGVVISRITDYPMNAVTFNSSNQSTLASAVFQLVRLLNTERIPYNILFTKNEVIVMPRRYEFAAPVTRFRVGVLEAAGEFILSDEEAADTVTPEDLSEVLRKTTIVSQKFESILERMKENVFVRRGIETSRGARVTAAFEGLLDLVSAQISLWMPYQNYEKLPHWIRERAFHGVLNQLREEPSFVAQKRLHNILSKDTSLVTLMTEQDSEILRIITGSKAQEVMSDIENNRSRDLGVRDLARKVWYTPSNDTWHIGYFTRSPFYWLPFYRQRPVATASIRFNKLAKETVDGTGRATLIPKFKNVEVDPAYRRRGIYEDVIASVVGKDIKHAWQSVKLEEKTLLQLYAALPEDPIEDRNGKQVTHIIKDPVFQERFLSLRARQEAAEKKGLPSPLTDWEKNALFEHIEQGLLNWASVMRELGKDEDVRENQAISSEQLGRMVLGSAYAKLGFELRVKAAEAEGEIQLFAKRVGASNARPDLETPLSVEAFQKIYPDVTLSRVEKTFITRFEDHFSVLPPKELVLQIGQAFENAELDEEGIRRFMTGLSPSSEGNTDFIAKFIKFKREYDRVRDIQQGALPHIHFLLIKERLSDKRLSALNAFWAQDLVIHHARLDGMSELEVLDWAARIDRIRSYIDKKMHPLDEALPKYSSSRDYEPIQGDSAEVLAEKAEKKRMVQRLFKLRNARSHLVQRQLALFGEKHPERVARDPHILLRLLALSIEDPQSKLHRAIHYMLKRNALTPFDFTTKQGNTEYFKYIRETKFRITDDREERPLQLDGFEATSLLQLAEIIQHATMEARSTQGARVITDSLVVPWFTKPMELRTKDIAKEVSGDIQPLVAAMKVQLQNLAKDPTDAVALEALVAQAKRIFKVIQKNPQDKSWKLLHHSITNGDMYSLNVRNHLQAVMGLAESIQYGAVSGEEAVENIERISAAVSKIDRAQRLLKEYGDSKYSTVFVGDKNDPSIELRRIDSAREREVEGVVQLMGLSNKTMAEPQDREGIRSQVNLRHLGAWATTFFKQANFGSFDETWSENDKNLIFLEVLYGMLEAYHPLVLLRESVKRRGRVIVFVQSKIKNWNTQWGPLATDEALAERHRLVDQAKERAQLLRLDHKTEGLAVTADIVDKKGGVEGLRIWMETVVNDLRANMDTHLVSRFVNYAQELSFTAFAGQSAMVQSNADEDILLAQMEALIASKIARMDHQKAQGGTLSAVFDQDRFDSLMEEALRLREALGLSNKIVGGVVEMPSEKEMRDVRNGLEPQNERQIDLKRYLEIIDLLDFPKPWVDAERPKDRRIQRIQYLLNRLRTVIDDRHVPRSAEDLRSFGGEVTEAVAMLQTSFKQPELTSSIPFYMEATENQGGTLFRADITQFYIHAMTRTAAAHLRYMKNTKRDAREMLRVAMEEDDNIKALVSDVTEETIMFIETPWDQGGLGATLRRFKLADGTTKIAGERQGGDEFALLINGDLSQEQLKRATEFAHNKHLRVSTLSISNPRDNKAVLVTEIAAMYGEQFLSFTTREKGFKEALPDAPGGVISIKRGPDGDVSSEFMYVDPQDGMVKVKYQDSDGSRISLEALEQIILSANGLKAGRQFVAAGETGVPIVVSQTNGLVEYMRVGNMIFVTSDVEVPAGLKLDPADGNVIVLQKPLMYWPFVAPMIAMMQQQDFRGQVVEDRGVGAGILSIVALKLGAKRVIGIDRSAEGLQEAAENMRINGITDEQFRLLQEDLGDWVDRSPENRSEITQTDKTIKLVNVGHFYEIQQKLEQANLNEAAETVFTLFGGFLDNDAIAAKLSPRDPTSVFTRAVLDKMGWNTTMGRFTETDRPKTYSVILAQPPAPGARAVESLKVSAPVKDAEPYSLVLGGRLNDAALTSADQITDYDRRLLKGVKVGAKLSVISFNQGMAAFMTTPQGQVAIFTLPFAPSAMPIETLDRNEESQAVPEEAGDVEDAFEKAQYNRMIAAAVREGAALRALPDEDYDESIPVQFRIITENMTGDQATELQKLASRIAGGQITAVVATSTSAFEGRPVNQGARIVYVGLNTPELIGAGSRIGAGALVFSEDFTVSALLAPFILHIGFQRSPRVTEPLRRLWEFLVQDPLVQLTADVFNRLKEVPYAATIDQFKDLTIRVAKVAWQTAVRSAARALSLVGSSA